MPITTTSSQTSSSGSGVPAHASAHQSGGSDAVKLDDVAAPDDNTDLNASTSKHGLCPKLDNDATHFLNGQGGWTVPPGTALTTAAGTYTPTRSAESNLDANVTPSEAQYMRVGSVVTVSGRVGVNPTLTATATSFELSLPVASNIGNVEDLAGVAFCGAIAGMGASISGSVANNTAVFSWVASDVTAQSFDYTFTYQII